MYIVLNKEEMIFNCLFRRRLLGASTATLEAPSTLQGLKIYSQWLVCAAFAVFVTDLGVLNSTHFSLLCHFIMALCGTEVTNTRDDLPIKGIIHEMQSTFKIDSSS